MSDDGRFDYPSVLPEHIGDAKLYADRGLLVQGLRQADVKRVMEVGVALGHFSKFLIEEFKPEEFVAVDLFELHREDILWGTPTAEIFGEQTHEQYYASRLPVSQTKYTIEKGMSDSVLRRHLDAGERFDFIYLDGDHRYEGVKKDTEICKRLLSVGRIMVFNDYTMNDAFHPDSDYGVVRCVNELLHEGGWRIEGFALQRHMFCDIALRKTG